MDTFLLDILWPLLQKLSSAKDVRRFLEINMPKWSSKNYELDRKNHAHTYKILEAKFIVLNVLPSTYTILDVSPHEVTWKEKYIISKIPRVGHESLTEERIGKIASSLLPLEYEGPCRNDPLQFVNMVRVIRDTTTKFDLVTAPKCNRDTIVDQDRSKLTCSNIRCKLCA